MHPGEGTGGDPIVVEAGPIAAAEVHPIAAEAEDPIAAVEVLPIAVEEEEEERPNHQEQGNHQEDRIDRTF